VPTPTLAGKIALVTGASRGIGRAIARRLAADGAVVAVHYRHDTSAAEETVADIESVGGQGFPIAADLAEPDAAQILFTRLESRLRADTGHPRLDILVNNASILDRGTVDDLDVAAFDRMVAVNTRAPLFLVQRALPLMGHGGRIINITSPVTRTAPPQIAYVMSKAALDALTRTLAPVLGPRGLTVTAVAPGLVATDMMPELADPAVRERAIAGSSLRRLGEPLDVADVVAFLASHDARAITGQVIDASGGLYLRPVS
jgi:NAD(P)-dependent dehydrogenase (short-subunit alcohol dehydrogenase family)